MTQKGLVEFVGVGRQTINAIERNKYSPTLEVAFRISRAFGASIEDVFFYDPDIEGEHPFADGLEVEITWDGDDRGDTDNDGN
jgi:putative transcriptional regulator